MKPPRSKSDLKTIGTKDLVWKSEKTNFIVIGGFAILWAVNWPTKASVQDYVDNVCDYVLRRLKTADTADRADTAIVFDRYYDFSIKSSTRLDRGSSSSQTRMLTLTSPFPPKTVTLSSSHNKVQLIKIIYDKLVLMTTSMDEYYSLLVTGTAQSPI